MPDQNFAKRDLQSGWEEAYRKCSGSLWSDDPIPILPRVLEAIRERGLKTVVDLGCGEGRNLVAMAAAGLHCIGIDFSKTALERAKHRLEKQRLKAFLLKGDISDPPLYNHSVDVAVCFDVFGQLLYPARVVEEIRRILTPGGLLAINAFTPSDSEFGHGKQIGERAFIYKETLFRFFEKEEIINLFPGWELLYIDKEIWIDPPHGDFRSYQHKHENWVLLVCSPR